MPRIAKAIALDATARAALRAIRKNQGPRSAMSLRAGIVLSAADGATNKQIAAELHLPPITVGKWRRAYAEFGIEGLRDSPRSGRPRKYGEAVRNKVLTRALQQPGFRKYWSIRALANDLKMPPSSVQAILADSHLQPRRIRAAFLGAGIASIAKLIEIAGLYRSPAGSAVVLCVDGRKKESPKRAFSGPFEDFMNGVADAYPSGALHAVVDQPEWKHPRAHFHYQRNHAAWASTLELLLSILAVE